ncbi:uncharacterized protein A4U43_C01F21590 [Asparagus officinalis]|uniref:Plantacyanin n=1 Tax=Asparagus officinalis TaxID=4686 RepID=A0A5P1FR38_ASPOF|nr:basic blue protein-like [Asparagus officinalis]ONK80775.1 uncharacterized protein A4U43_C01F21590 [Asparagus officinalis]
MSRAILGVVLICSSVLLGINVSESAEFNVGDRDGWNYNVGDWPNGKSFATGDVLVFNYAPEEHNVVVVDAAAYNSCGTSPGAVVFTSGNDRATLAKGDNYFLCSFPGHCEQGMKIAVNAA